MNFQECQERISNIKTDALISEIISEGKDFVIENLQEQLQQGLITSDGLYKPLKNKEYREYKISKNPDAEGNWDLKDTGDFYNEMKITADNKGYFTTSTDSKFSDLSDKFGTNDLLGTTPETIERLNMKLIIPEMVRKIKEKINA